MAEITYVDVPTGKKDPVTIVVDKSAANGDGPLQIEAKNEEENVFDVACKGEEDGKVSFVFTPPTPAAYQLHITWGGDHVMHSPLRLNLNKTNNRSVTISEAPSGNLKAGENIRIGFDASEAGRGNMSSTCKTGDDQEIEVIVTKQGFTAMYNVEFQPPHEDLYILGVKWEGKNVKGSPFKLDMNPILSSKVIASNFKEPNEPGDTIELDVCIKGARNAELTCTCKGDVVGEIPVEKKRISGNDFHLTASTDTAQPDTYTFEILYNGLPISNSVHTYCTNPPKPEGLGADGVKHISTKDDDSPVILTFDASEAGEGNLRARVHGADSGPLDCTSEQLPDANQHYQVTFDPPSADSYLVDTYWNDSPVPGSPFGVLILRPEQIKFGEPRFVELEIPVELSVDASEAGPGKLTATCKGEKSGEMEVFIEDDLVASGKNKYIVSFRPSEYDCYSLSLFFDDNEVSKSPFAIRIDEPEPEPQPTPPPAPKFSLSGVSVRKFYVIGEKISFSVNASNASEGYLRVSIDCPSTNEDNESQAQIQTSEDGSDKLFNVEYTPNVCGEHKMQVQWDEEPIPGSPLIFSVVDKSDVPTFPITKPYSIQFTNYVDLKAVESFGIHEETGDTNNLTITKRRNKKVKLIYQAKELGIHSLHVLVDRKEIPGSPFRVEFVKSNPSACKLLYIPDVAYLGEEASFTLDARKSGAGDLKVHAHVPQGGREAPITHKNHENGFYTIVFVPDIAGTYHFDVSWADEPVFESPVKIEAQERVSSLEEAKEAAAKVYVHKDDQAVFEKVLSIASPAYICISTGNAGKGKLSLKALGPSEAKISLYDRENGVYTAEIRPVLSGKYTLGIFWNDIHIKNSPFKLDFTKDKSYLINQLDLDNVRFVIDLPHKFNVHCPPEESTDLIMMCTPTTAAHISCTSLDENPNSFLYEIIPKEVGNHEIAIKYNGKEVHNSPHNVQFEENLDSANQADEDHLIPMDVSIDIGTPIESISMPLDDVSPSEVRLFGTGLEDGLVGQEGNFTIETANAGQGKMEVEVFGPKGAFKVNIRRHPDNYRTLLARYDPKVVGEYKIHVLWDSKHVSESPYSVTISEQVPEQEEKPEPSNKAEPEPTKELLEIEIEPSSTEQDKPSEDIVKTDVSIEDDNKEADKTDIN